MLGLLRRPKVRASTPCHKRKSHDTDDLGWANLAGANEMQHIPPLVMLTPNTVTRMLFPHRNGGPLSPMPRSNFWSTSQTPVSPRIHPSFSATPETFRPLAIQVRVLQELCPPITIFSKATVFAHNLHPQYVHWDLHFLEVKTGQKVRIADCRRQPHPQPQG